MGRLSYRLAVPLVAAFLTAGIGVAFAQSGGEQKPPETPARPPGGEPPKDAPKKIDEFTEAEQVLGGPASNPECVWLGRRVVNLLWRDDLDTAFRHLDLYDRFGCPGGHIQATFRCVVRQGNIDPKTPEKLSGRVHSCWINPTLAPPPATTAGTPGPEAR